MAAFNYDTIGVNGMRSQLKFLFTPYMALTREVVACLKQHPEAVVVSQSNHPNRVGEHRALHINWRWRDYRIRLSSSNTMPKIQLKTCRSKPVRIWEP